jgi:zinc/manganese transport system substrate-binding protein
MTAISQGKIKVVSSASIFQDMVMNIGGDKIEAFSIVPIGGDPHLYEPKPSDAQLVKSANIILVNGLTFEGWINKLIENSGTTAKVYTITEGVNVIKSERYKNAADPHAWMDASNGLKYIENIKTALIVTDAINADFYTANYEKYKAEITALDNYIATEIKKIPEAKRMLVTSHDAFAYYGKRYNIRLNALKGISTEAETQTSDMVRVAKAIQESEVPAIFIESTINPQVIQQIARDNNVKIGGELFADSIGDEDSEGPTYIKMLRHNTDVIVKALGQNIMTATKIDSDNSENNWLIYLIVCLVMLGALALAVTKFNK